MARMKTARLLAGGVLALGLVPGCASTDRESPGDSKTTAAARLETARVETQEAKRAVQDYALTQKAEFVAEMKKSLAETQAELDRVSRTVENIEAAKKEEAQKALDAAREKWDRAKKELDTAENATEANWDEVKRGVRRSYAEFKDSVADTRLWMSEKIAPP